MPSASFDQFKQNNPHLDDVWPFLDLLRKESDRGSVLISKGFLKADDYDSEKLSEFRVNATGQFETAAVALIMNFLNRPHYVAKQRRTPQKWPY
jgi:predicted deacetylase